MLKAHLANIRSTSGLPRLDPLSLCVGGIATPSNREILVSEIDTCLQYQQLGGRAQAHQIAPHFVRPLIGGWMDHISDGIKWPSELRELQPEQILAEWQAAVALQEKIQKDCVDLLAALRGAQVSRYAELARDARNLDRGAARGIRF